MKKIKISGFDEEILANFGFAPEALNEMYDVLDQTKKVIMDYFPNAPSYPSPLRKKIAELDIEADSLFLEFNELYMMTSELIENYKKLADASPSGDYTNRIVVLSDLVNNLKSQC